MTSGFHLAATQICNALRISHINFEELTQPTEMFCADCQKNYMRITSGTTPGDVRVATLEHYQQEHTTMWRTLVDAGEDFLSVENLFDCSDNLRNLLIVCPVEECCKWFNHKIPPHAQLGDGPLDISHELQHYFVSMLAKHYMETHSLRDLPIPTTH